MKTVAVGPGQTHHTQRERERSCRMLSEVPADALAEDGCIDAWLSVLV